MRAHHAPAFIVVNPQIPGPTDVRERDADGVEHQLRTGISFSNVPFAAVALLLELELVGDHKVDDNDSIAKDRMAGTRRTARVGVATGAAPRSAGVPSR